MDEEKAAFEDLSEIVEDDPSLDCGHESHEYDMEAADSISNNDDAIMNPTVDLDLEQSQDDSFHLFGRSSQEESSPTPYIPSALPQRPSHADETAQAAPDGVVRAIQFDSQKSSSEESLERKVVGDVISDISDEGSLFEPAEAAATTIGGGDMIHATTSWDTPGSQDSANALADSRELAEDELWTASSPVRMSSSPNQGVDAAIEGTSQISPSIDRIGVGGIDQSREQHGLAPRPCTRTIATQTSLQDDDAESCSTPDVTNVSVTPQCQQYNAGATLYDMMMDHSMLSDIENQRSPDIQLHQRSSDTELNQRSSDIQLQRSSDIQLHQRSPDTELQPHSPDNELHQRSSDLQPRSRHIELRPHSTDIENQRSPDVQLQSYSIDMNTSLDVSQHSEDSVFEVVTPEPKKRRKKKPPKPLKMGRERRHKRKATEIKHPLQRAELPYVDAKEDLSENNEENDGMEFLDSRSNLSDEEADAMEWTGTVPWGLGDDVSPTSKGTTASESMEERLRVASFVVYHVTTHWPQLLAILYWDRSPSVYAAPWICGMVAMRWIGRQQHRRPIVTSSTAAVGYALWASADFVHDSLVFVGLLLASAHEPRLKPQTNTRLRHGCIVVSYLVGGIVFEAAGKLGVGAFGATLLAINVVFLYALDNLEKKRMIASESTSRLSIIVSREALPTILETDEKTTLVSLLQTCTVGAVHGLITTTIPWLVAFEYDWSNAIVLGGLFAFAAALAPIVPLVLATRFATYAMTYTTLLAGLPYRWTFIVGFLLLPSCMKAAPTSPLNDSPAFITYWLAASSSPLLFVVMPHAPAVVACCIAFAASIVEFLDKSSRKAATSDSTPASYGLQPLHKPLF